MTKMNKFFSNYINEKDMRKIVFTSILTFFCLASYGQTDYDKFNQFVYEMVLFKKGMDSTEVKKENIIISIPNIVQSGLPKNKHYAIRRIGTLSSPDNYLIVIVEDNKFTYIDMDLYKDTDIIRKVFESFKRSNVSKKEMILYMNELLRLIDIKNRDNIRM